MHKSIALFICAASIAAVAAIPARAGDIAPVKCGANQDRIWLYDSLSTFNVASKIPCGETVEILSRVKGYVKVHTLEGVDGFIAEAALPNLPPFEEVNANGTPANESLGAIAR